MITKDEFRAEAGAFLEANAKRRVKASQGWGEGSDEVGILPERTPEEDAVILAEAKEWRAKVFDAGFGWITGPEAYGGRGLPREYERIWQSLENDYDVPSIGPFGIGLGMVAPTILAHAVEDVRQRYLARPLPGRRRRLPAVLRAGGRLRPGRHPDQGDPRRRGVGPQRPEGVDVGRPLLRHRRDHHPHVDLPRQPPPRA